MFDYFQGEDAQYAFDFVELAKEVADLSAPDEECGC